jgi:sulfur-carrier protein
MWVFLSQDLNYPLWRISLISPQSCFDQVDMNITVKLFAFLRKDRFDTKHMECEANSTAGHICRKIGIRDDEPLIFLVNGRHAELDYALAEGDTLAIFPIVGGG